MSHQHNHDESSKNIGWAFSLNLMFTIIEFIGGILTNSTAILADAVHDLGDSISLGLGWFLHKLSKKQPNQKFSYGYKRFTLAGAFINAIVLIAGSIWVLLEAIPRLWDPVMPIAEGVVVLAVFGVTVNGYAAYRLSRGKSLNEKVLNWHLLEDVLGWAAVLIVGTVLMFVDWPILDPILSIGFTLFILVNVLRNLSATLKLFSQATPDEETYQNIEQSLRKLPFVADIHHLHFWSLDGEEHVLTAHLVLTENIDSNARTELKRNIETELAKYDLSHTTIELEHPDERCRDENT